MKAPKAQAINKIPSPNLALKRGLIIVSVAAAVLIIIGVTGLLILNSLGGTRHDAVAVAPNVTVQTFATLPGDAAYPTAITQGPDGTFYIATLGSDIVYKAAADGKLTPWLPAGSRLTAPSALHTLPDGSLIAIDFTSSNPGAAVGAIKVISAQGQVSIYANSENNQGLTFLSHLTFDAQRNLYVTYTATGEVWRFPASGQSASWLKLSGVGSTQAQPTGIVYDPSANALFIADAGTGTIYQVKLKADGSADQPLVLYRQAGATLQGLALDPAGRLLMTQWMHDNGQLARLEKDGSLTLLAQSFRAPTDILAVGDKIYVVNSDLQGLDPLLRSHPPFTIDVVTLPPGKQFF